MSSSKITPGTEQKEKECVKILRKRLQDDGGSVLHFEDLITDRLLLYFIRGRKYDVNYAFKTLCHHFYLRQEKYKNIFLRLIPSQAIPNRLYYPLKTVEDGNVVAFRLGYTPFVTDPSFDFDDFMIKLILEFEEIARCDAIELKGICMIVDCDGFTWRHALWTATFSNISKAFNILHKASPIRLIAVHFLNAPYTFRGAVSFMRHFMAEKLRDRLQFHSPPFETLHNHIPKKCLPLWMNGELSDEDAFDLDVQTRITAKEEEYKRLVEKIKEFQESSK